MGLSSATCLFVLPLGLQNVRSLGQNNDVIMENEQKGVEPAFF